MKTLIKSFINKNWKLALISLGIASLLIAPVIYQTVHAEPAQAILGIQCTGTGVTLKYGGTTTPADCTASQHYDLIVKPILTRMVEILPFAIAVVLPLSLAIMVITWIIRRMKSKNMGL